MIENELRQFILENLLEGSGQAEVADDEALVATGRIDSLGLIKLIGHIQQQYRVDLMASGGPDDFESISSMAAAIRRHG
ncbi:MAG: hypothetical protein IT349_14985 [Candidatus Eisenbacteria bacterium]|nr:hypothetical protein [Candidatus Eisenbacteria bacterium]MCC7143400.1 hypothetical protein [Candidatus Eisenbacteria bacterium]